MTVAQVEGGFGITKIAALGDRQGAGPGRRRLRRRGRRARRRAARSRRRSPPSRRSRSRRSSRARLEAVLVEVGVDDAGAVVAGRARVGDRLQHALHRAVAVGGRGRRVAAELLREARLEVGRAAPRPAACRRCACPRAAPAGRAARLGSPPAATCRMPAALKSGTVTRRGVDDRGDDLRVADRAARGLRLQLLVGAAEIERGEVDRERAGAAARVGERELLAVDEVAARAARVRRSASRP